MVPRKLIKAVVYLVVATLVISTVIMGIGFLY
ncbi:stressosome-associated protein Prli42 [Microaerobacter geothermalis]